uniref:Ig-like domain-containing protein n=1 Tax=Panagrellus redivivus TaxID=6233 RepID=A0A7E4V5P8_PANRE
MTVLRPERGEVMMTSSNEKPGLRKRRSVVYKYTGASGKKAQSVEREPCISFPERVRRQSLGITYKTMFTISVFVFSLLGIAVMGLDNSSITIDLQSVSVDITQYYYPSSISLICPLTPHDTTGSVLANEEYLYANNSTLPANVKLQRFKNAAGNAYTPVFIVSKPTVVNTGEYTCCYPTIITNANETEPSSTCYRTKLTVSEAASFDLTETAENASVGVSLGRTNSFWLVHQNLVPTSVTCKAGGENPPANVKTSNENSFTQLVITATTKANLAAYDCTVLYMIDNKPNVVNKKFVLTEAVVPVYPWNGLPEDLSNGGTNGAISNTISNFLLAAVTVMLFGRFHM